MGKIEITGFEVVTPEMIERDELKSEVQELKKIIKGNLDNMNQDNAQINKLQKENESWKNVFKIIVPEDKIVTIEESKNIILNITKENKDLKKLLRESYNQIKEICDNMNLTADEDLLKSIEDGLKR